MVKRNLTLTELVSEAECYLPDVKSEEIRGKMLELIAEFKLDSIYDSMKETAEWERWSKLSEKIKIHYEECPKLVCEKLSEEPRLYLRDWADGLNARCAVIKIEKDIRR